MTNDDVDRRVPRREASPLRWSSDDEGEQPPLTETQRSAARQLWALFANYYLDEAPTRSRYHERRGPRDDLRAVMPVIDTERRSQVISIDGGRGSGKTALLVTLIDAWNQAAASNEGPRESGIGCVCDRHGRVVPVGLLDLRSLPNDTSLLLQVSGKIRSLVDELGISQSHSAPPISPQHPNVEDAQRAWRDFLTAAASTEQRMRMRSAELDPESFAVELHETEQDRLHVGERFAQLMDHIVAALEERRARLRGVSKPSGRDTPVFVLAIDDADMNPARLGECFELLDALVHPRLVFVLTGHTPLFLDSLRAQFLGELRQPFAQAQLGDADRARLRDISQAFELAQRYYDKLIPAHQRCTLPELAPHERIEKLHEELEGIALGDASVGTVFDRLPALGALLPGHLREIDDFQNKLQHLRRCTAGRGATDFLLLMKARVKRELKEEEYTEFDVDELISSGHGSLFDTGAPMYRITTRSLSSFSWYNEYAVRPGGRHDRTALYKVYRFGVRLPPEESEEHKDGGEDDSEPRHVDVLDHRISLLAHLIEYMGPHLENVEFEFKSSLGIGSSPIVTTRLNIREYGLVDFKWPRPTVFFTDWERLEFHRLWSRALAEIVTGPSFTEDQLELIAINYINIVVHTSTTPLSREDLAVLHPPPEAREAQWKDILARAYARRDRLINWIAIDLLELAHPESRLSADAAGRLIDAWSVTHHAIAGLESFTSVEAQLAQSDRIRWGKLTEIAQEANRSATELRAKIDQHFEGHPWSERLASLVDIDALTPLRSALAQIQIGPEPLASWLPSDAAGYLHSVCEGRQQRIWSPGTYSSPSYVNAPRLHWRSEPRTMRVPSSSRLSTGFAASWRGSRSPSRSIHRRTS